MKPLSPQAQSLWAKKSRAGDSLWLPLHEHMQDAAIVAEKIWDSWVAPGVKNAITDGLDEVSAEQLLVFLAAVHDLGKAIPAFQFGRSFPFHGPLDEQVHDAILFTGLPGCEPAAFFNRSVTPHALAGQLLLEAAGCNRNIASIVGAHHGKPQSYDALVTRRISAYDYNYHLGSEGRIAWQAVQQELIDYALSLAALDHLSQLPKPNLRSQVLLTGLIIMIDWIVSNEEDFPYRALTPSSEPYDPIERALSGWNRLSLTDPWVSRVEGEVEDIFQDRFGFAQPNELQITATEIARNLEWPGIMGIEAPMGGGKTEAALAVAEYLAEKSRRNGIYFALPTQATSDAIFPRITQWIGNLGATVGQSITLAHGKAQFNDEFISLRAFDGQTNVDDDEDTSLMVHQWFKGRKKSMLSDFVVGTIDQLLLAALKQKHLMLRHLGLAQKVVIIDECHAYDAYMSQYLERALQWLGAYQVPVIVLSATLPMAQRKAVINAYLNVDDADRLETDLFGNPIESPANNAPWTESREYPLITYTDGDEVLQKALVWQEEDKEIQLAYLQASDLTQRLQELLCDGGCAGVIVNTVKKAQEIAKELRAHFGEEAVNLLHSRFLAPDRTSKEQALLRALGKPSVATERPKLRIDIGTQVLEQSLDIDFDVLVTELAPMDLVLQRMGRLHRHKRQRPERLQGAQCYVMGDVDEMQASEIIYGRYLLERTRELLPEHIRLPHDIPELVHQTYACVSENEESEASSEINSDLKSYLHRLALKRERAQKYRLGRVWPDNNHHLVGWLDLDLSDQHGEAAVRDSDDTVEVLLVQDRGAGTYSLLSQSVSRLIIQGTDTPDEARGRLIARERINLPRALCHPGAIDQTISDLEGLTLKYLSSWQECSWLKGELVLILDQNSSARLNGWVLTYSTEDGLLYEKEEGENGG